MKKNITSVVILGASGRIGTRLLTGLLEAGFTVSVVSRPSSQTSFPQDALVYRAEYDDVKALTEIFNGQDAVVSCITTLSCDMQKAAIDAALEAGVKRFIPSEFSGDTSRANSFSFKFASNTKLDIVTYLRTKEAEGLTWTAICTGAIIDMLLGNAHFGYDIANQKALVFDNGNYEHVMTTFRQLSRAVISTLQHPDQTRNNYVYVRSFNVTQNLLVQRLECLSGSRYTIDRDTAKEADARGKVFLEDGDIVGGYTNLSLALSYGPYGYTSFASKTEPWIEALKIPADEELDEIVRSALEKN